MMTRVRVSPDNSTYVAAHKLGNQRIGVVVDNELVVELDSEATAMRISKVFAEAAKCLREQAQREEDEELR